MAWRDELRSASFRGVPFHVEGGTLTFGRRLAVHEYPQREKPYVEDLGKKARQYQLEAFVIGSDYMSKRDALIAALETPGAGQLIHPYYGSVVVTVTGDITVSETTDRGGMARISTTFIEAGELNAPDVMTDTVAVVAEAETDFLDDVKQWFADTFNVKGLNDYVPEAALTAVNKLLKLEGMALGALGWVRTAVSSDLKVLLPETLASQLASPFPLATGLLACINRAQTLKELASFKLQRIETDDTDTTIRRQTNQNSYALETLVRAAVISRQIQEAVQITPTAVTAAKALTSSDSSTTATDSTETSTTTVFTTEDATAAREFIVERTDELLFDEEFGETAKASLLTLRNAVLAHVESITPTLPMIRTEQIKRVMPAIVLAHRFYGDDWQTDGREEELIARNNVRHPGFVTPSKALKVVDYE